jgi:integrase/recombinase XerD
MENFSTGLPICTRTGERTSLLLPIGGTHRTMARGAVHLIVKQVFDNAIDHLQSTVSDPFSTSTN